MTALHQAIEYSALGWVKPELDETLRLAQIEIEGFIDDPSDSSRMRVCAELLHQVQGTLRMVELYAPAMVAEEMEHLAQALEQGRVEDRENACSALIRGVVQLPDYLERLQSGHKEISIVLLPVLNELRGARGETGLSESVLFVPDLNRALPASLPRASASVARASDVTPYLVRLRDALQGWPEHGAPRDPEGLQFAIEALLARTTDDDQRRMLWVGSMVAAALQERALAPSSSLRQAFSSVEREARRPFENDGFGMPRAEATLEPTRQLLYHVAHSDSEHPALAKLREVFDLDSLKPSESELDHARGSIAGRNRALLDTVSAAVKEELLRVKDELDLYLRTGRHDPASLQPQVEALTRVSDTLGMLGLGMARGMVQQQRDEMLQIVRGEREANETALLDIAGALLYVDASLDAQVERLASGDSAEAGEDLAASEARKVLDVLLREAIGNFAAARQAFDAFIETDWRHAELEGVPKLLVDVGGALRILELPQAADFLDGVRLYTEVELLQRRRIPNSRQLDTFADALASVEYYLEALRDQRGNRDDILDITRNSLESLGYWPLPAPVATESLEARPVPAIETAPAAFDSINKVAIDEAAVEVVTLDASTLGTSALDVGASDTDAGSIETFELGVVESRTAIDVLSDVPLATSEAGEGIRQVPEPVLSHDEIESIDDKVVAGIAAAGLVPAEVVDETPREPEWMPGMVAPFAAGFDSTSDDIDDEIREIFLEEFEEEISNLRTLLPVWRAAPNNLEAMYPVRRVFHTLKGSGRLVGAKTLGEFSWKIESMLNRVRDGHRPASPAVIAMTELAADVLPQLHAALRGEGEVTADLRSMEMLAERIAAGEDVMPNLALMTPVASPVEASTPAKAPEALPMPALEELATDGVPFSVDPVLYEILQAEVGGHLATIDAWLERAKHEPMPVDDGLVRSIHTMNGAFAMTEVPGITDALSPAEGYVRRLMAAAHPVDAEGVAAIGELSLRTRDTIAALAVPGARVPRCDALAAQLAVLRDRLPEVKPSIIVEEFVADAPAFEAPAFDAPAPGEGLETIELTEIDLSEFNAFADRIPADSSVDLRPAFYSQPEPSEADRLDAERLEAERLEAERLESERLEAERLEAERLESERLEAERLEAERLEAERLEAERLEAERLEAERLEAERLEAERLEAERLEAERLEAERLEAERLEAERLEAERLEAERLEAERLEAERLEAERLEAERLEAERLEAERLEAERLESERLEAERLEAERLESERLEAERLEAERLEAERLESERLEAERLEAERLESERLEAERLEAERLEAQRLDAERLETERLGAEVLEMQVFDGGILEADLLEAERLLAESDGADTYGLELDLIGGDVAFVDLPAAFADDTAAETPAFTEDAFTEDAFVEHAFVEHTFAQEPPAFVDEPLVDEPVVLVDEELPAFADMGEIPSRTEPPVDQPEPLPMSAEDPDLPLDMHELDAELVDIFVEEAQDLLDHSDQLLVKLRDTPEERETIVGMQRDLHTLKGGARMAGIMPVGELGHTMESMLEAVAEHRTEIGGSDIPLLERGFDRLHAMVTRVGARRAIGMPARLIGEFEERVFGKRITTEPGAEEVAIILDAPVSDDAPVQLPESENIVASPQKTEAAALAGLSAPIDFGAVLGDEEVGLRGSQEQVRVRAELLDRLVNYAGEVAIYRSRLEQQLGAFRGATAEMGQTNLRLRDQLRRLEIETEAQIIARYQREGEQRDETFDPLELDRFSTLQQLSRALSETATDLTSLQATLDDMTQQYETLLLQQSRVSSELQEGLMRTRMLPFDTVVPRLRRVLRQACSDTGKSVQLKVDGAQGELDRNVLERMTAPLEHMLRNAVAHGLEMPAKRNSEGKAEEGTVRIAIRKEGSEVVLQISDDGAGLDRKAIRERAEARGLVRKEAVLTNAQLDSMILEPGFSTASEVSRLAGRGVGMDVVASEVRQLGGTLDIQSEKGKGCTFTLRLPQTLAVTQAAFVRIGETLFAVPIASVRGVGRIPRETLAEGSTSYRYGNEEYVLHDLGKLIGHTPAKAEGQLQMPLLLTRSGDLHVAVSVDQIVGNREIVVKPIGPQVASIPGIFGATIMGDGSVVVILDVAPLVRRIVAQPEVIEETPVVALEDRQVPLVMVVDDSITMRKVTGRVLERNNFEVVTAKDGLDAFERLMTDRVPDLMLLDIEMPRMDGYELATAMKADPRLRNVPIIMITSRTGEKHRQRAMDIGVNRYLGKPYQENELMRNVFSLLEETQGKAMRNDG
jgi:chemosensory pili system protein ChpA (sensor histidine kinase/response regulator)